MRYALRLAGAGTILDQGHRRMPLVCFCGVVIRVLGVSWDIVACLLCASWWVLGSFGASLYASWVPLVTSPYVSCEHLDGSWVPSGASSSSLLGYRRTSRVCLLVGPGCLWGFAICVLGASWYIVVCLFCAPRCILYAFGASSYASCVRLGTPSYVSCALVGGSCVPLWIRHIGTCVTTFPMAGHLDACNYIARLFASPGETRRGGPGFLFLRVYSVLTSIAPSGRW